ncbi:Pyridine nucleotide-disulfide oxidoreductase, FAD/NAD(P)-binding domain containing protein [Desulfovibrio sp. X2]|uniref:NAD(P)/FAD-dependent oxidoreductase n=1 Tax=Desulfovibrio sp. X2 TaxID=941449 RepID=UPI000358C688|nr:FAD-dependent oxidoreductase [Desulfovibrio sp. X2]EPR42229.1 Pyridine nucleotide-disulfide oxidoreductase, FAD/NAD(P)-binding domain containing protein [Desulfovibrio sp. X2]
MKTFDAVVIGGGPAGMTAALYLLRSHLNVALVEKLSTGGQMLMTERIDNYPGFPEGIEAWELADRMAAQVKSWEHEESARFNDEVKAIEPGEELHKVLVGDEWIAGRVVLICSGAQYRRLGLPGEKELTGRGVSYCALCDGNFFRDKEVAVIGGGNSALEEALYLARLVKKLHLIHRRDDFRATKCYQNKCFVNPKMQILRSSVVLRILGETEVTGITLQDLKNGEIRDIPLDGVFIFVGFEPQGSAFFPESLQKDGHGFLITDQEMRTNIPGIYAAGDIRSKTCRQVASAVGDGAVAAHNMMSYLEHHGK